MSVFLLDVNALVALSWPRHQFHERTQSWFAKHSEKGWATCPFTQAGFVRVVSNPAFSGGTVTLSDAMRSLEATTKHSGHQFWKDELSLPDAVFPIKLKILGHQQVTDAYLLGLATYKKGKLATLDQRIVALLGMGIVPHQHVELILGQ